MQTPKTLLVCALVFFGILALAQTNVRMIWRTWSPFTIDGVPYITRIDGYAGLSGQPWDSSKPLPLHLSAVERIARKQLQTLVPNNGAWEAESFEICRGSWQPKTRDWYYKVSFRSTVPRQGATSTNDVDTAVFYVDFSGNPGLLERR